MSTVRDTSGRRQQISAMVRERGSVQVAPLAEPAVEAKRAAHVDEKTRIGALAASMVRPGESVVLDSGTTTLQIAHHLPDDEEITVLTNDLDILCALARKE